MSLTIGMPVMVAAGEGSPGPVALVAAGILAVALGWWLRVAVPPLLGRWRVPDFERTSEPILRAVAQHANDGLVYQDMDARIIWANPAYCRTMGWKLEEIVGRRPQEFCFPPEIKPTDEEIANFRFDPDQEDFYKLTRHPNVRRNGERFWLELSLSIIEPKPGLLRVVLVSRDVTEQVQRENELQLIQEELSHAANHDPLTGLLNRAAFLGEGDTYLKSVDRPDPHMGVLYIDLDRFKSINDLHGHAAGDAVLIHVADAIRSSMCRADFACRIGGDEFVVACPGVSDFETMNRLADVLLDRINEPIPWDEASIHGGASIGIALNSQQLATMDELIKNADFALYEAKNTVTRGIARYDSALRARKMTDARLLAEFEAALDSQQIQFQFQPIVRSGSCHLRGFETLARWVREDGTRVPPDQFLEFAARLKRTTDIDFAAITAAAELAAEFRSLGYHVDGSFNASADTLSHPDFIDHLENETNALGLKPSDLVVEVLETTFFGPSATNSLAAAQISELRKRGFSVFLDDFGVGYAGLSHLRQLDISGIKLDRSLVASVTTDPSTRIITTSIMRMCQELDRSIVAEGVETAEQSEFLALHGCDYQQGFGFAKPMDRGALIDLVEWNDHIRIQDPDPDPEQASAKTRAG